MKLYKILKDTFNAKEGELGDNFEMIGYEEWDSMAHMFFITKLEEEYEMDLTGDEVFAMKTVGDVKKVLADKGKAD